MFSILYYASPNVRQPGFRWVTPGGALAVILWLIASAAFALFVEAATPPTATRSSHRAPSRAERVEA